MFWFGCALPNPQLTQLQIREFQTRTYPVKDSKLVMKALLNVLQDEGFIVKNADTDLGLLTATKETNVENSGALLLALLGGSDARWEKIAIVECSANVSELEGATKVRVNFQVKKLDNHGQVIDVGTILDPEFYQSFFAKVDKGVFLQKQDL